ncbi:hypothetical protein F2Q69_00029332 [Brassica cretica]|uniref:Reverse transcriptase zinc-binding domain-containing protein n=1 Tax=Brassica cretica TaxID=69181 RepID=A0A8S9RV48_BRACR|nr:hypothetical protein F2Q69_00029332 [Brassica cretica]
MFPELSKEQQQSAMLYISHADPTERRARIERVNQSIQEKREKELNYRPAFTTDLLKGAGMVLCYDKEGEQLQYIYSKGAESSPKTRSLPGQREIDEVSSGQSSTHSLNAGSPTGFCMGASSKPSASGTISTQKKPRNRPPAWKRRLRLLTGASTKNGNGDNSEDISEGMAKRKATDSTGEGVSDHKPIRLNFALEVEEKHKGRFFFDKRLYGKKGVEEAIARCWSVDSENLEASIMDCIARCRTELAKLKRTENLNSKTRIDQLKMDLEKEIAKQDLVFDTFSPEDAERIMLMKSDLSKEDSIRWSFTKDGTYSTRSGYQFTDALLEFQSQNNQSLPPIEKKLWSSIWKVKSPPKIKHFIWRSLTVALAVKERLQTRGIPIDATCLGCDAASESICHLLFHCDKTRQTWELSNVPLPPARFSRNSVFLNMFHLISVMNNNRLEQKIRQAIPWLLWQIWKARNSHTFKATVVPPRQIVTLAFDEAEIWIAANSPQAET